MNTLTKKSNVLHISQRYYPAIGGAEKYMQKISEHLVRQGHSVTVWTSDAVEADALWDTEKERSPKTDEVINGVHVHRFTTTPRGISSKWINKGARRILSMIPIWRVRCFGSPPTTWGMLKYARTLAKNNFDAVHVSAMPYHFLHYVGLLISKRLEIPLILTPFVHIGESDHDPLRKLYLNPLTVHFYKEAALIFVQTDAERDAISHLCAAHARPLNQSVFCKLGMGIDPKELSGGKAERFRKKYSISGPIVLHVGTKNENKGVFSLITASQKLWDTKHTFTLVLIGAEPQEYKEFLAKIPEKYHRNIRSLENCSESDKNDAYAACDMLSLISKGDSFGIVYLEAWYYKKPVLGCDSPAIREVIHDGIDGLLIEFGDISSIAQAISHLLENPDVRKRLGERGFSTVLKHFTWQKKLEIIDRNYAKLIQNPT